MASPRLELVMSFSRLFSSTARGTLLKKLRHHSLKRGTTENGILLGSFVDEHLHQMDGEFLQEYQVIISENDVDLFNWISGVRPIPEKYKSSKVLAHLYDFCQERKIRRSHTHNNLN